LEGFFQSNKQVTNMKFYLPTAINLRDIRDRK
jgi:hypothetical protein